MLLKSWLSSLSLSRLRIRRLKTQRRTNRDPQTLAQLEQLEARQLLTALTPKTLGSIHTSGDAGSFEYYASGNDDPFSEFGIASFQASKVDFGLAGNQAIDDITDARFTLTHNDRSFSDGDEVEVFLTTQAFGGDYSSLTYDASLINGIDFSQFTAAPVSLGVFAYTPEAGGSTDTFSLNFAAQEATIINLLNTGGEFSLIIGVTDPADDVTYSGLNNTFDPGDPVLDLDVTSTSVPDSQGPALTATSPTDDAVDVPVDSVLVATFDELVQAGVGNLVIHRASDDSVVETIDINSGQVTVVANRVVVDPSVELDSLTEFYIKVQADAVRDIEGNAFAGVTDTTSWSFTTTNSDTAPEFTFVGPFQISQHSLAGTVVGDIQAINDGISEAGINYSITGVLSGESMAEGQGGFDVEPVFTVGEVFSGTTGALNPFSAGNYAPPGILDGLGAYRLNADTVRVFANHELGFSAGYDYRVSDGLGGSYTLSGARISYFDIDRATRQIVDAGVAYNAIYDAEGNRATDLGFLANDLPGFSRFCSAQLIEPHQFGSGRGLEDRIYFTGEEDGGGFNPVGGAAWALDVATGSLWHVPAFGRGAWESVTEVDTGSADHVAFLLSDDTSPFDADNDGGSEAAPLFLYVGEKDLGGDFLARNGLRDGKLYVWVSDNGDTTPAQFNSSGTRSGSWVEVDNTPSGTPSEDGSTGFDEWGYPTQRNLWSQAEAVGSFGFSRPEDLATNPADGTQAIFASTGVDTYAGGADTFGTIYTITLDFSDINAPTADVTIVYDGDADPNRGIRSPDNLEWADDGFAYIQEDEAEEDTLSGEPLFGPGAVNPNEAGIIRLNPATGELLRVATIDRSVVIDRSIANPSLAVDLNAGFDGEWETSGIIDVSSLFDEPAGSLFLFDIQAHGIADQEGINADSRITDNDLVEGGQLSFLRKRDTMAFTEAGYRAQQIFTVGEVLQGTSGALNPFSAGDYVAPGILDGLGAYELNETTVRVFANHELLNFAGYDYEVSDGQGGSFTLSGARISYFDIDKATRSIVDAGIAYNTIYDALGNVASDLSFLANDLAGFSRFCSAQLIEAHQFGQGRGLEDRIYFTGEEDGGFFNRVGGAAWALDPATGNLWHIPDFGRGAWESFTEIDTGTTTHVAFILADDSSPFNFDADPENEAAPAYLYVGEKDPNGDFLERNGLRGGRLYVWVSDTGELTPGDFNGDGSINGRWVAINNDRVGSVSEDGSTGFDEWGYPTQGTLWNRAEDVGAFGFSRPEDVATNPHDGTEIVFASTGVDNFVGGVDTFGTLYTIKTDFTNLNSPTATLTIIYDGDADPLRQLRSPDNLEWSADGFIYVQEDKAENQTLSGEPLFGPGAINPNEAGIVRIDPRTGAARRVATIDRNVILDGSLANPSDAVDNDAAVAGAWESSGIIDVSRLFGEAPGSLFLFDIQAHGIDDQNTHNATSRITDDDLAEGGQLVLLEKARSPFQINPHTGVITVNDTDLLREAAGQVVRLEVEATDGSFRTTELVDIFINDAAPAQHDQEVRFATFNASLNRGTPNALVQDLATPNNAQARRIADIIQTTNPDVILINEFDYDSAGRAAELFRQNYLEVGGSDSDPIYFGYMYVAPVNTGVASGLDLNNDGSVGGPDDALGFGTFEGQYGMLLLSKYPIQTDQIRSFQQFRWKDMPGALLPADPNDADGNGDLQHWYTPEELQALPLSSKSHWDIPINVDGRIVHALAAHPTPPVFDGPEDRNGRRNHDEIRFWADYISGNGTYIYDDAEFAAAGSQTPQSPSGGLPAGESFVILGDYNADPFDGDSTNNAILQLLDSPFVNTDLTPSSAGGVEQSTVQGGINAAHIGDPAFDTGDFNDGDPGNLRVDYALPSADLAIRDAQVFWPESSDPAFGLVGASDHRLTYVDIVTLEAPAPSNELEVSVLSRLNLDGAEISAYDPASQRMFVTGGSLQIVDVSDPTNPQLIGVVDPRNWGFDSDSITSVAVHDGLVAAALPADNVQAPGHVLFMTMDGQLIRSIEVGSLPDMLTFTPDGEFVLVANEGEPDGKLAYTPSMMTGLEGYHVDPLHTVGDTITGTTGDLNASTAGDYQPVGILDGIGAFELNHSTVRVFVNHELNSGSGASYTLANGATLTGARISYVDIDKASRSIVNAGLAFDTIINAQGLEVTDGNKIEIGDGNGLARLCSGILVDAGTYGFVDTIYFAGEESSGANGGRGGLEYALDAVSGELYALPALGYAAWENVTPIDTGDRDSTALLVGDDRAAAPLYLWVGRKGWDAAGAPSNSFLARNGLAYGTLYHWKADNGDTTPQQFNGTGNSRTGTWVAMSDLSSIAAQDAEVAANGGFTFSRPEDVATNPNDGTQAVLASTGRGGLFPADDWGTTYLIDIDFAAGGIPATAAISILYDGDDAGNGQFSHPDFGMRSPDNLDWADDGLIYLQEDRSTSLNDFGGTSGEEASIWRLDPSDGSLTRVGRINRSTVSPNDSSDGDPTDLGDWESSGILDVSDLFGEAPGSLFLFDVQAHSIRDGAIRDNGLVEGGQLSFLMSGELARRHDPSGSVSVIDLSQGVAEATVRTAGFEAFDGRENDLRNRGVRIFPGRSFSQDVEPEYIAVSPDGTTAFIALQEANAFGVLDIGRAAIVDVLPLGVKDHSQGMARLVQTYTFDNLPVLGTTATVNPEDPSETVPGQDILLGGLSGLYFESVDPETGVLTFLTVPDRGPNGAPTDVDNDGDDERPFALPDYQAQVLRVDFDPVGQTVTVRDRILLVRQDGSTPITGLPNIPGVDEEPVDLFGNPLPYDEFGADLEGIVLDADGSFWMVDEYRPAIYHVAADGVLINRFVPEGTGALGGQPAGTYGVESLPSEYSTRRGNRGFEAVAIDADNDRLYAFIQTPLANPNRATSDASKVIRILEIDTLTGNPVGEYVFLMEDPSFRDGNLDKIGDAVYLADGRFHVIVRDSSTVANAKKFIFEIDIRFATNVLGRDFGAETLEQQTPDDLAAQGIRPVEKIKVTNLPSIGYVAGDKAEGLALLPDGRLVVLNDNDFGLADVPLPVDGTIPLNPNPTPIVAGVIEFVDGNRLDASDRDGAINLQNAPVYGMFMPDGLASFEVDGQTFYISANEGDDRGENEDIGDITLDPTAFPNRDELQDNAVLGRLGASTIDGDLDGDGDYDQLFVYGGRSFSIWDSFGNLVYDSSDEIGRITAVQTPSLFNANEADPDEFDSRSDNKGAEPEGITTGVIEGRTYAFVGLERAGGGVMIYDVTNPVDAQFVRYVRTPGDVAPEGLVFISASDSPNGKPMLAVTNEVSGTLVLLGIEVANEAPVIAPVAVQAGTVDTPINVTLDVSDADTPPDVLTIDSFAQTVVSYVDQRFGLYSDGNLWENWGGKGEKWLRAAEDGNAWYYITPDGMLFKWDTVSNRGNVSGDAVVRLDPQFHSSIGLLWDAAAAYELDREFGFYTTGNTWDDFLGQNETWFRGRNANDAWFFITPAGEVYQWGSVSILVGLLRPEFHASPEQVWAAADQPVELRSAAVSVATALDQQDDLELYGDIRPDNWGDRGEKWLISKQPGEPLYFILPDGTVWQWDGISGPQANGSPLHGTLLVTLDPSYHVSPELLANAAEAFAADLQEGLVDGDSHYNWGGLQEKWLRNDAGDWYFITTDGSLFRWDRTPSATGTLVGTFGAAYYHNTSLLTGAANRAVPLDHAMVTAIPPAGYVGGAVITTTVSDGKEEDRTSFGVEWGSLDTIFSDPQRLFGSLI